MTRTRMILLSVVAAAVIGVPVGYALAQGEGSTDASAPASDRYAGLTSAEPSAPPTSVEQVPCSDIMTPTQKDADQPQVCLKANGIGPALDGGIPVKTMQMICAAEPAESADKGPCADLPQDLAGAVSP